MFAWSYSDFRGIPAHIAQYTITLQPGTKPIRQKQRRLNPRIQLVLKAELERLFKAGFIRLVDLVDWVSPMVLVRKKNGKLRVCIDYRALNKCTVKDDFPLPFLNIILEEVAGKQRYTFFDGYFGYNQLASIQKTGIRQRLLPLGVPLFSLSCLLAYVMHRLHFNEP